MPQDAALADIARIELSRATAACVIEAFPGMKERYVRLSLAILACRRRGKLPFVESEIERLVQAVLSSPLDQPLADSVRPAFRAAPVG